MKCQHTNPFLGTVTRLWYLAVLLVGVRLGSNTAEAQTFAYVSNRVWEGIGLCQRNQGKTNHRLQRLELPWLLTDNVHN